MDPQLPLSRVGRGTEAPGGERRQQEEEELELMLLQVL